ncbi:MAG: hypothetical protein VSS75_016470, partial [Candidatus Parabeggiatoa sp.]|nr:hypothetical protein [Candidatus Parabeggiatoa sp.]
MTSKLFLEKLGKLYHSGNNGFEGLVRDLLESLTGRKWFLAKSGSQGGSDMISEEIRGNRIVAECKRFRETKLKESELREKLADTLGKYVNNPPDAWILVTTSRLDAQTNESLKQYCHIQGIEFSTIDARGDNASDLAILCAHNPNLTTDFFKVNLNLSESEATNIQNELVNLSAQTNYSQQLNELKAKFAHESIGFNNWHIRQNEWLLERFASEKESRAAFGQPLNIRETGIDVIDRYEAYGKLNTWLTSWGEHHAPFVMLGEEGDGKTWTIATWLAQNMNKFPPIIFITSKLVSSNEPITLLVNIIKKQLSEPRNGYWEKRFKNWLGRAKTSEPLLVLVLDGVNENIKFDWRGLLESLDVEPWLARLALILTCRTEYWKRHFEYYLTEHVWTLPSFNDKELSQALATKALNRTDIPQSVMNLISKPRYFDLMVQLKDKIADSGDVTVERLIYEDWKDRTRRKKQVENLNNEDFLSLISDISEKFKDKTSLKRADIEIYFKNSTDLFEEFVSSKILVRKTGIKERYVVDKKYLIVGLGRLLADEIWNIANHGIPVIEETIAHWLEPQSDMDIKVAICGAAVFQALMSDDFPETARTALFIYWINGQNLEEETWDRVPTYLSIRPETYLNVAENLWSLSSYNQIAQDMMMEGFLRYGKWPKIQQALIPRFENWMGFIYLYGYAYRGFGKTEEKRQEERQKIAERIGKNNIDVGPLEVTDYVLNVITDEGLLQLARVALAVISHQPRKPYIKAITTGILARTIMGYVNFEAEIAWTLRTAPDHIWPLIEEKAQQFLEVNMTVYKQAAYWLLTYSGHSKAYQLRQQLPENLVSKNWVWEQCRDNPCELHFCQWTKDNYQTCLSKTNDAFLIAKALKQIALDPKLPIPDNLSQKLEPIREGIQHEKLSTYLGQTGEDILLKEGEVAVCAIAPNILADILKRLARSLPQRANQTLHKAAWRISENRLIMTEAEKEAICRAWLSVLGQDGNHDDSLAENVLFFCTIQDRDASEQIELLLLRGDKTSYFNDSPPIFKPLSSKKAIEYLQKTEEITDTAFLTNVLWFISANPKSVPNSAKQYILNLLDSDKSHIRASVLQIILGMENKTLGQAVIEKGWQWNNKNSDEENHWGSLILCEFGTDMPYSDLLLRVSPTLAGYMLKKRGCDKEEILQYADYLMEIWKHITGQKIAISEEISKIELIYDVQSNEVSPDFRTISDEPHG